MTIPQYLAATGQDQQEFVDERAGRRRRGRARRPRAARGGRPGGDRGDRRRGRRRGRTHWPSRWTRSPQRCARDLERRGVLEAVRSDIARGKALEFLDRPRGGGRRRRQHRSICRSRQPDASDGAERDGPDIDESQSDEHCTGEPAARKRSQRREQLPERLRPATSPRTRPAAATRNDIFSRLAAGPHHLPRHARSTTSSPTSIIAQLLHLESEDPDKDISIYINSPGGEITGLFAIYDTMQFIKPDVSTICIGQAASAAAVILASGDARQALHPPARPRADPPAARWCVGPGGRHRDPGQGDRAHARARSTRSSPTTPARTVEKVAQATPTATSS